MCLLKKLGLFMSFVSVVWIPPPFSIIKLNVDVAFPSNSDFHRVSMVARDSSGSCLWWCSSVIIGRPLPIDIEQERYYLL